MKDVKDSILFYGATVETCVELVSRCPVVCQFVPYAVARNKSILASVTSGRGEGPSIPLKVAVVVPQSSSPAM
jgi:hypothetical protein